MKETSNSEIRIQREWTVKTSSTSKGNQKKWRSPKGLWIKADSLGYEGLAEAAATHVLNHSNIDEFVEYKMCTIIDEEGHKYIGCASKDFLNQGEVFVSIYKLMEKNGITIKTKNKSATELMEEVISITKEITGLTDFDTYLGKMLEFDALILNEDRHLNNIGIIYNEITGKYKKAPIFDNGLSFLSHLADYSMYDRVSNNINRVKSKPFSSSFKKQLKATYNIVGSNLKIDRKVLEMHTDHIKEYDKPYINRVKAIIKIQLQKYNHLMQ